MYLLGQPNTSTLAEVYQNNIVTLDELVAQAEEKHRESEADEFLKNLREEQREAAAGGSIAKDEL